MTAQIEYPLGKNHPELIQTPTGKKLSDLTFGKAIEGEVTPDDLRIAPEVLELQAQVCERDGRPQLAENFRRAAELTAIPDDRVLEIYNALRPGASTAAQMIAIAEELEEKYSAKRSAALFREAAEVYERRNILAD